MKIFIGGIAQETNSFSPLRTGVDQFKKGYYLFGEAIPQELRSANIEIAGFFSELSRSGEEADIIPGFFAWAVAAGPLRREALAGLSETLLEEIKKALPCDGILLCLHGALVGEGEDDCEGFLLEKIRAVAGAETPIVCALDFHAVLTDRMVEFSNLLVGYRTYPHIDMKETGERAAAALLRLIKNRPRLFPIRRRAPLLLPVDNTETDEGPMAEVIEGLEKWEKEPGVFSASAFNPHPWLDIADHGVALLLYAEEEGREKMEGEASRLAGRIWSRRDEFYRNFDNIETFLNNFSRYEKPVAAVDSGDITSAGGVGDSTVFLRALLKVPHPPLTILPLVDAGAVATAFAAGEGAEIDFVLNRNARADSYNSTVSLRGAVRRLSDSPVTVKGKSFSGLTLNPGRRALLRVHEKAYLLLTEQSTLMHDPEFLRSMGLEPGKFDLIVQKSHKLFREGYRKIVKSVVTVDTPGCTDRNIKRLPYRKIRRPIYPLDDEFHYQP